VKKSILIIFVLLSCTALLNTAIAADDFKAEVAKAAKDFSDATASKNDAKLGLMYAEDAIAFPPNSEMVKGRKAIQAFWKGIMDAGMRLTVETVDVESEGNLGSEVGKYTVLDASGKAVDQGKYVVVWKKGNDGWKLYRDIWNSNMPAAPAK
jgi:ketosteroid isomerase-like protein